MKSSLRTSSFFIILVFYTLSLLPLVDKIASENTNVDLREAVQTMQKLNPNSPEALSNFKNSFTASVKALQTVAGLHSIIIKQVNENGGQQPSLITISFRLPCLPGGDTNPPSPAVGLSYSFQDISCYYDSIELSPELPPPVTS